MDPLVVNMLDREGGGGGGVVVARGQPAKTPYPPPNPFHSASPLSGPRVSVPGNGKRFKLLELL